MEYKRLEPLESESSSETAEVTLKTIREILAESGDEDLLVPARPAPAAAPVAAPEAAAEPEPEPEVLSPASRFPPLPAQEEDPPTLLQRLSTRIFGDR